MWKPPAMQRLKEPFQTALSKMLLDSTLMPPVEISQMQNRAIQLCFLKKCRDFPPPHVHVIANREENKQII